MNSVRQPSDDATKTTHSPISVRTQHDYVSAVIENHDLEPVSREVLVLVQTQVDT